MIVIRVGPGRSRNINPALSTPRRTGGAVERLEPMDTRFVERAGASSLISVTMQLTSA